MLPREPRGIKRRKDPKYQSHIVKLTFKPTCNSPSLPRKSDTLLYTHEGEHFEVFVFNEMVL